MPKPVALTAHAATVAQAVQGAAQKLAHLLDSTLGRLQAHRVQHGPHPSDPSEGPATRFPRP
ncbi:hypothetical protein IP87_19875 [beta proteobacterium AAP121]|nr:hypothetical protein IP80_10380 [beta proteobacterium AAP65]KPF94089.1 hypothetical protein IP87_19875 [beta proteobacterium AAP121]